MSIYDIYTTYIRHIYDIYEYMVDGKDVGDIYKIIIILVGKSYLYQLRYYHSYFYCM